MAYYRYRPDLSVARERLAVAEERRAARAAIEEPLPAQQRREPQELRLDRRSVVGVRRAASLNSSNDGDAEPSIRSIGSVQTARPVCRSTMSTVASRALRLSETERTGDAEHETILPSFG